MVITALCTHQWAHYGDYCSVDMSGGGGGGTMVITALKTSPTMVISAL